MRMRPYMAVSMTTTEFGGQVAFRDSPVQYERISDPGIKHGLIICSQIDNMLLLAKHKLAKFQYFIRNDNIIVVFG